MDAELLLRAYKAYEETSSLFWFAGVQYLNIPQPETYPVPITNPKMILNEKKIPQEMLTSINFVTMNLKFPLFIRTDYFASKRGFKYTCFVESKDRLLPNILNLILDNVKRGISPKVLLFRRYIEPDWRFKAFHGELPIAKEARVLIHKGDVIEIFPMWDWTDFVNAPPSPEEYHKVTKKLEKLPPTKRYEFLEKFDPNPYLPEGWFELLKEVNQLSEDDREVLKENARLVARRLRFSWVLDFMKGKDGKWYFIDAQRAELGFIPYFRREEFERKGIPTLVHLIEKQLLF